MLGLRVRVRGHPTLTLALLQDSYLVSAGASWRRHGRSRTAQLHFQGTGIDDRDDHLKWLWVPDPPPASWIDVSVVEASTPTVPRRHRRRKINWRQFFSRIRERDLRRIAELETRLRKLKSGTPYPVPIWSSRPPAVGFRVTLNGRQLGRIGVADPGSLSVAVYARQRNERQSVYLSVHGGDQLGHQTWRWCEWAWGERRLSIGDRVRIAFIPPVRLDTNGVGELDTREAVRPTDISKELRELRMWLKSDLYRKETAAMLEAERTRFPARRYSRMNRAQESR